MTVQSCCPGCAHEEACGHAEVTMCANREPADPIGAGTADVDARALVDGWAKLNTSAPTPGTPGCSCDGLRNALAERDRYRMIALRGGSVEQVACDAVRLLDECWAEHRRPASIEIGMLMIRLENVGVKA